MGLSQIRHSKEQFAKFFVGDRVKRPMDVYEDIQKWVWRYGIITEIYSESNRYGYYPELYTVRWVDGTIEKGFLPHGLFFENEKIINRGLVKKDENCS